MNASKETALAGSGCQESVMLTETCLPPPATGRQRTVMSTWEVIDRFVHNRHEHCRSGNLHLDWGVLYSYGRHWPLARWVRRVGGDAPDFVLLRSDRGSTTTSTKHRTPTAGALRQAGVPHFTVPFIYNDGRFAHESNYAYLTGEAEALAGAAFRGPLRLRGVKATGAVGLLRVAFAYAGAVGLAAAYPTPEMPDAILYDWVGEFEPALTRCRDCVSALAGPFPAGVTTNGD